MSKIHQFDETFQQESENVEQMKIMLREKENQYKEKLVKINGDLENIQKKKSKSQAEIF